MQKLRLVIEIFEKFRDFRKESQLNYGTSAGSRPGPEKCDLPHTPSVLGKGGVYHKKYFFRKFLRCSALACTVDPIVILDGGTYPNAPLTEFRAITISTSDNRLEALAKFWAPEGVGPMPQPGFS